MEFIAGSIARHCGIQKVTSGFIHLFRWVSICLWLCLVLSVSALLLSALPLCLLPSVFLLLIPFLLLIIRYASVLFSLYTGSPEGLFISASSHQWSVSPVPMTFEPPWCMFWTQLYRTSQFHGPPLAYLSLCFLPLNPLEAERQWDQGSHSVVARLVGQDLFIGICRVHMILNHHLWKPWKWSHLGKKKKKKKRDFETIPKNGTWMSCFH